MQTTRFIFIVFFSTIISEITTASYSIHKAYNLDLSNNAVLCMHQDNDGYMWFGTYNGLNLYNGKNVFIYRYEMDNRNSLCSNIIHKITRADDEHIWVSTFLGLNKFSLKEKKVTESYTNCPEAKLIMTDTLGNTWVVCKTNYISHYRPESQTFTDLYLPGISPDNICTVFVDTDDTPCLVMKNGTLRKIYHDGNKNLTIQDTPLDEHGLSSAFYEEGNIYLVNNRNRLSVYSVSGQQSTCITDLSPFENKYGRISQILSFQDDLFLSFKGEGIIKLEAGNNYQPETLSSFIGIFCMMKDKNQDLLWIGTDGQGVEMYYRNNEIFRNLKSSDLPVNIQKPIRSIYTDEYDNLWAGTKGDGIIRINNYSRQDNTYSNGTDRVVQYTIDDGLSNNSVYSFLRSSYKNIIWIGTEGPGLSYYSYDENKICTLPNDMIKNVHSICEVSPTVLWLATTENGLIEATIGGGYR